MPSGKYWVLVQVLGAATLLTAVALMRRRVRIRGFNSWMAVAVFGPAGALAAWPVAAAIEMDTSVAIPIFGIAVVLSLVMIHWIVPHAAQDFQTDNMGTSCLLAILLGISTIVAGFSSKDIESFGWDIAPLEGFPSATDDSPAP